MSVKNCTIYLAANGEVGRGAQVFDTLEEAQATSFDYIDVFENGVWITSWKQIFEINDNRQRILPGTWTQDF